MLTIYNVGQGDSMLLEGAAASFCCFDDEPLLIDCGLQKAAVHSLIGLPKKRLRVLITHADRDHIGGLNDVLAAHQTSRLYIPRYLPEIQRIEDYLRKKASRKNPRLPKAGVVKRIEVSEGDFLCSHAAIMNPPKKAKVALDALNVGAFSLTDVRSALVALQERGLDLDVADIESYAPEPIGHVESDGGPSDQVAGGRGNRERRKFFLGFFVYLAQRLQNPREASAPDHRSRDDFYPTEDPRLNEAISEAIQLAANQVSIVFRYHGATTFLFTGDADPSVFKRIKTRGHTLQAEYLKVPHHGSRNNLDLDTLMDVAPRVAVISHGNAKFGGDPDSHPHREIISLLDNQGVLTYYTNDVIKNSAMLISANSGKSACNQLFFK